MPYTVTIYVAAPGTPLKTGGTSLAGHVYYATSDGQSKNSFGFAPVEHGASKGTGQRWDNDMDNYQNPAYARTMEISAEQYNKLNQFGASPDRVGGFNMQYDGAKNSCIDYTWAALNHAGLHSRVFGFFERKGYEGSLKPMSNIDDIKSIEVPFRGSPLNREVTNPMPDRSLLQWIITEGESQTKFAANERSTLITDKTLVAMNDLCDRYNYNDPTLRDNTCWGSAKAAVHTDTFTGNGKIIAGVDGKDIVLREENGAFNFALARVDANAVSKVPSEQSKQEILSYQPMVASMDNDLSQVKTRSGPTMG